MPVRVFHSSSTLRAWLSLAHTTGKSLGFVPTMGALHQGHASLMHASVAHNHLTVASVFVNPTQFGPHEDLDRYPKTPEADILLLEQAGVDAVYMPDVSDIYFPQSFFGVSIRDMDAVLCGASRPGHFNGVCLVVGKLFNLIRPDHAYFGLKDFQQFAILCRFAQEWSFPVKMHGEPTVRESDGLAMSSRNRYLNPNERAVAPALYQALQAAHTAAKNGADTESCRHAALEIMHSHPEFKLDYLEIRNGKTLVHAESMPGTDDRIFVAAFLGKTRLIDNMPVFG